MPATAWITERFNQIIILLIVLAPPLEVLLTGRRLLDEDLYDSFLDEPSVVVMRLATIVIVLLASLVIALSLIQRRGSGAGFGVMAGFLVFFFTNTLLCVPFGREAFIDRSHIYPLILFAAIYLSRDDGPDGLIDAAKWGLLIMMAASLVCGLIYPEMTRRVYAPEVRLPFIDFRFWGLGEHPNAIAPLALVQILLTLHRPFQWKALQILSFVTGGFVILLAQSQTVWVIAILVVPGFMLYQRPAGRFSSLRPLLSPKLLVPVGVLLSVVSIGLAFWQWLYMPADGPSQLGEDEMLLTGRPEAWNAAIYTFLQHPIFGYGLLAWERDFRENVHLPWAVHAHNQLLQSLSVAGLVGGIGLLVYLGVLLRASVTTAQTTRGLGPALLAIILIRAITEVPLNLGSIPVSDTITHLLLFRLLVTLQPLAVSRVIMRSGMILPRAQPDGSPTR